MTFHDWLEVGITAFVFFVMFQYGRFTGRWEKRDMQKEAIYVLITSFDAVSAHIKELIKQEKSK
jgi:hypothetical protein